MLNEQLLVDKRLCHMGLKDNYFFTQIPLEFYGLGLMGCDLLQVLNLAGF